MPRTLTDDEIARLLRDIDKAEERRVKALARKPKPKGRDPQWTLSA